MREYTTHSREETVALGRALAKELPAGALVAFTGGLGAGKTAFCQGLAEGLAAPTPSAARRSPSSITTAARARWRTLTCTASTARGTSPPPVLRLPRPGGVVACEWSENCAALLAQEQPLYIDIERVDDTTRHITIR